MGIFLSGESKRSGRVVTPDHGHKKHESDMPGRSDAGRDDVRRPYDTNELDKVPRPTEDDPPYRSWWVL
jgi:hypothetical protein